MKTKKCRRSVPFRDCRFPQAGAYGKNLPFGKLTNEFAPPPLNNGAKEKRTRVPQVGAFQGLPFPASGNLRQKFAFRQIDERVRPLNNGAKEKRTRRALFSFLLVPLVGVEPTRYRYHGILSPARLPIPPQRLIPRQTNYCIER